MADEAAGAARESGRAGQEAVAEESPDEEEPLSETEAERGPSKFAQRRADRVIHGGKKKKPGEERSPADVGTAHGPLPNDWHQLPNGTYQQYERVRDCKVFRLPPALSSLPRMRLYTLAAVLLLLLPYAAVTSLAHTLRQKLIANGGATPRLR